MSYLEELLPEFRNGAKIRCKDWPDGVYVYTENGKIFQSHPSLDCYEDLGSDLISDKWEFYPKPIDWYYVIKNKCLCVFTTEDNETFYGFLSGVSGEAAYAPIRYMSTEGKIAVTCQPVHKDEVTFYEYKTDEY